ncbi:unnamed protein product, partial [Tetraodon nigroviridis]
EGGHGNDGLLLGRPLDQPEQLVADKSLLEILDGMVMMYSLSVHQQLGKVRAWPGAWPHRAGPHPRLRPPPDGGGLRGRPRVRRGPEGHRGQDGPLPVQERGHPGGAPEEPEGVCREAEPPEPEVGLDQRHHLLQGGRLLLSHLCASSCLTSAPPPVSPLRLLLSHLCASSCLTSAPPPPLRRIPLLQEKMLDVYWLLCVCIRTIERADGAGSLFAFVPEFYLGVAMNAYSALKNYFSPVNSMDELPGSEETLTRLASILTKHFADPRIVGTDIKDSLMQALASYVCYPQSLRAVERIPQEQRLAMMKNLLAPYEQRPWAQTNWILVRLWRGCGFGYRYTRLPHLLKTKPEDANLPSLQSKC